MRKFILGFDPQKMVNKRLGYVRYERNGEEELENLILKFKDGRGMKISFWISDPE
jgi:hypothetical protein